MTRSTKNVPPRRSIGLGAVLRFGDHLEIVRGVATSARVRHHVIYLVLFGIVALAAALKFGDHFAPIASRDVTRVSRPEFFREQQCDNKREQQGLGWVCEPLSNHERKSADSEQSKPVAQPLPEQFAPRSERRKNHQAEHDQREHQKVLIHGAAALYSLAGEVSIA